MSDDDAFEFQARDLDTLIKAIKENMSRVRVGTLGGASGRHQSVVDEIKKGSSSSKIAKQSKLMNSEGYLTNADIGAMHEFGTSTIPQRSFLRVPIAENLGKRLESAGAFSEDEMKKVVKEKSLKPWLKRIAILAEAIVSDAFDSGGDGKWPKWKTKGYENNTGMLLVDTQQLRNSITSDVK